MGDSAINDRLARAAGTAVDKISPELQKAEQAFRSGNIELGLQLAENVIAADPGAAGAYFLLGKIHQLRNELDLAVSDFSMAHRLAPTCFEFILEHAISLFNADKKQEALPVFQQAQRLQPANQTVKNYLNLLARTSRLNRRRAHGARSMHSAIAEHTGSHSRPPGSAPSTPPSPAATPAQHEQHPRPHSTPHQSAGHLPSTASHQERHSLPGAKIQPEQHTPPSSPTRPAGSHPGAQPSMVQSKPVHAGSAIAEAFGGTRAETRAERLARLRQADLDMVDEGEIDLSDPDFWEKYRHFSTTRDVQLSAAEMSGDVHVIAQDFNKLHRREYEKELELKSKMPVAAPLTAYILTLVAWALGALYLGRRGRAVNLFLAEGFILMLLVFFGFLYARPIVTPSRVKAIYSKCFSYNQRQWDKLLKKEPGFIKGKQALVKNLSAGAFIIFALIWLALETRLASSAYEEARLRNFSLGLITEISQDFIFSVNLGSAHGISQNTKMIVEKRSFAGAFNNETGVEQMENRFTRIGRCEILEIAAFTSRCAYHPDKGRVVIPKVGDRITVVG